MIAEPGPDRDPEPDPEPRSNVIPLHTRSAHLKPSAPANPETAAHHLAQMRETLQRAIDKREGRGK